MAAPTCQTRTVSARRVGPLGPGALAVAMAEIRTIAANDRPARCPRRWRRHNQAIPTAPAATSTWRVCNVPSGRAAATRATRAIQRMHTREGKCSTVAAHDGRNPATQPAGRPQIITGPAAGTASRLAGSETTGMPPKMANCTGATPIWAASVTPTASASDRGPGSRSAIRPARNAIPNVAPTLSHHPAE